MDISATVRAARRSLGLSQRGLGVCLGVSAKTVASWESGGRVPSVSALRQVLALQGRELSSELPEGEPSAELVRHLYLPLTARLRLALGEHANPRVRATGDAWRALLVLGRLGRAVVQPPVATGVWIAVAASRNVRVVVHQPHSEVPTLAGAEVSVSAEPPAASLVPVTVEGPVRVWVLPPGELLAAEAAQLRQADRLLAASASRDDAGRRAPAHRDPNEWVEAARMLMTKASNGLERPMPELGRAWRLGASVSLAQAVRLETWRRAHPGS